jgi:MOSC domain-containing protein YiiM
MDPSLPHVRALQLARVLQGGRVREGDPVQLLDVNPEAPRPIVPRLP